MLRLKPSDISFIGISFLLFVSEAISADITKWTSIQLIASSYYKLPTANVLRCGKLCEKQGKCTAATFDKHERMCYMHDKYHAKIAEGIVATGKEGRYLYKRFREQSSRGELPENECSTDTKILLPSSLGESGNCFNFKETQYKKECPPSAVLAGYQYYADLGICYRLGKELVSCDDAVRLCNKEGGHLILVENNAINSWIARLLKSRKLNDAVCVDGRDKEIEGTFMSYKQEVMTWFLWNSGEPNDNGGSEDCIFIEPKHQYTWNDASCGKAIRYICQVDT